MLFGALHAQESEIPSRKEDSRTKHQDEFSGNRQTVDLSSLEIVIERIADAMEAKLQNEDRSWEKEYAAHDLDTQESMAADARWMLYVTGAGVLFTGIGVVLIFLTLRHTSAAASYARDAVQEGKRAADAAEEMITTALKMGVAQSQAYPIIEDIGYRYHAQEGGPRAWAIIKNTGQTPAHNIMCTLLVRPLGFGDALYQQGVFVRSLGNGENAKAVWSPEFRIYDDEIINLIKEKKAVFKLVIVLNWESSFPMKGDESRSFHYIAKSESDDDFEIDFEVRPFVSVDGIDIGNDREEIG